ncbi:MAG TPA: DUF2283 domain-containing protein [Spirochaetales bacterium]|nr:DUF2283 domain-containing protein [Spirochaetales bacterium]
MKFHYYKETDSLYIDLSEKTSTDSQEVAPGIVLDFDDSGKLVGIDIQNASENVELTSLEVDEIPLRKMSIQ